MRIIVMNARFAIIFIIFHKKLLTLCFIRYIFKLTKTKYIFGGSNMNAAVVKNEKVGFVSGIFEKFVKFNANHKEISAAFLMLNGHFVPYCED